MGLPIRLTTTHSWLIDVMTIRFAGPFVIFAIALLPALIAMMLFWLVWAAAALLGLHRPAEEWAIAFGLLASAPWNRALLRRNVRVDLLWVPAWLLCLVLGAFGLVKAAGLIG
jgi:hypothetical protein